MKKTLIFFLVIFNCFSKDSFTGSMGVIAGASDNIYKDDTELFIVPMLSLKYNKFFFSGNSLGINLGNKYIRTSFSLEGSYKKTVLKSGDLDEKVKDSRKSPLYFNFLATKNFKNNSLTALYKRDFSTDGNIIALDLSHMFMDSRIKELRIIPRIRYTGYDKSYSNYYFNFTETEYSEMNLPYKENNFTSQIDTGILVLYRINPKWNLNFNYQISFYDKNYLSNTQNDSMSSVFMTGLTYSF